MSIEYLTHVWKNEIDVDGTHLVMLLAIADSAGEDGSCYFGIPYAAKKIRASESTARNKIKRLAQAHKIIIVPRGGIQTKSGNTNRYVIVARGINCGSYQELCEAWNVKPMPYKPMKKDQRGGNNKEGANGRQNDDLLNSTGDGVLNSTGDDLLNSTGKPLGEPLGETKDFAARGESRPTFKDDDTDLKTELCELVAQGSFGKRWEDIGAQAGRCKALTNQLFKLIPDIDLQLLGRAYKAYKNDNPPTDSRGNMVRLKSPNTIADHYQRQLDAKNQPKVTADAFRSRNIFAEVYDD